MIKLATLYKYNSNKKAQSWEIVVEGDSYYTIEGLVGGKMTKSLPTKCYGKNAGRANVTTDEEQAHKEALSKWNKKIRKGYSLLLKSSGVSYFKPQLAHTHEKGTIDFSKNDVYVQPKLDGLRCDNFGGVGTSRNGKVFYSVPHLLQNEVRLDGELYNHQLKADFNEIVSHTRKKSPTAKQLEESKIIQYWAYDFPDHPGVFSERYKALKDWHASTSHSSKEYIIIVPTIKVHSDEEIDRWLENFLEQGYEGLMVRLDAKYEKDKRSNNLLKYKVFVDGEFKIIGYEEGNGGRTGTIGKFILQHDKYPLERFSCNVKGKFAYLKEVWRDRDTYLGKTATVKYFNRTPRREDIDPKRDNNGDVPRFGYIIKIGREDYE